MITEDYVSFKIAKLLKEKGFDAECDYLYADGELLRAQGGACNWNNGETLFADYRNECSAPTLQMAMKWLRETHKLCITIIPKVTDDDGSGGCLWEWVVTHLLIKQSVSSELFESYEEACETAIKYCLKLI